MNKIIDRVENVDRGAFVSENFGINFGGRLFQQNRYKSLTPMPDAVLPHAVNAHAPIRAYGTRWRRKQPAIRCRSAAMLVSKVPVTLFFPFCDAVCLSGRETGQQSCPLLFDVLFRGARMGL